MSKQFPFTLPDHLKQQLEAHAKESEASIAQIIRTAIVQYLKNKGT